MLYQKQVLVRVKLLQPSPEAATPSPQASSLLRPVVSPQASSLLRPVVSPQASSLLRPVVSLQKSPPMALCQPETTPMQEPQLPLVPLVQLH
jgi:hypothetical protein